MTKAMLRVSDDEAQEVLQHIQQVASVVNTSPDGSTVLVSDAVIQWMRAEGFMVFIVTAPQNRSSVVDLVPSHMRLSLYDMSHA